MSIDCLNNILGGLIILLLVSFSMRWCIVSDRDFPAFMVLKDFTTTSLVMSNSSYGYVVFVSSKCGRFSSCSFVNTDAKYLFKILALSWSTMVVLPCSFFNAPIVDFISVFD